MKIEIIKVEKHKWEEIETSEKYMNEYRRHSADYWEHKLGVHGWNTIVDPSIYESAYVEFKRKRKNNGTKSEVVNK